MSMHDGIPFMEFSKAGNKIFINPSNITIVMDAPKEEMERRKSTADKMALVWYVGSNTTDVKQAQAFTGFTGEELTKYINDHMKNYKHKLADEALLS